MQNLYRICLLPFLAVVFGSAGQVFAQSRVIEIGTTGNAIQSVAVKTSSQPSFPQSTANARQRKWDAILSKTFSTEFEKVKNCKQLVFALRSVGLPVILDQSARDDSLDESEPITLQLPEEPLYDRLQNALIEKNSVLLITGNTLRIVSLDMVYDPIYFLSLSYDVTALNADTEALIEQVQSAVDPIEWEDNGGANVIKSIELNGQRIFTINAPYTVHREIRRFLGDLFQLQHSLANSAASGNKMGALSSSRVIDLPITQAIRKKKGKFGGGGIGGFGLGGGVF